MYEKLLQSQRFVVLLVQRRKVDVLRRYLLKSTLPKKEEGEGSSGNTEACSHLSSARCLILSLKRFALGQLTVDALSPFFW